ncbi:hypothetical protein JZ751_011256 [Albula glossodonta]|uniref:Uncharacterized protein n=1 Tax=Albula glossodonta TaxID=121402 RepID=A0A8T2NWR5_9TELE|nr:hypothetical protein JZ751_011256 [Albula glossodonta]
MTEKRGPGQKFNTHTNIAVCASPANGPIRRLILAKAPMDTAAAPPALFVARFVEAIQRSQWQEGNCGLFSTQMASISPLAPTTEQGCALMASSPPCATTQPSRLLGLFVMNYGAEERRRREGLEGVRRVTEL